jgi:hypothetical protein
MKLTLRFLLIVIFALSGKTAYAAQAALCGNEGVWIQILGAGGPELDDGNAGPSYLVWLSARRSHRGLSQLRQRLVLF